MQLCLNSEDTYFLNHLACDMMMAVDLEHFVVNNDQEFLEREEAFAKSLSAQKSVQLHLKNHNTDNPEKWIRGLETCIESAAQQMNSSCDDRRKVVDIDLFDSLKMTVFADEDESTFKSVLNEILKQKDIGPMFRRVLSIIMQERQHAGIQIVNFAGAGGRVITLNCLQNSLSGQVSKTWSEFHCLRGFSLGGMSRRDVQKWSLRYFSEL